MTFVRNPKKGRDLIHLGGNQESFIKELGKEVKWEDEGSTAGMGQDQCPWIKP